MKVIKRLKSGKAAGGDMIPSEVLKNEGEELTLEIWKLICKIWECEQIPDDWKEAIVCPVFKKGDVMICGNYRGISLLCITYKVLSMILLNRITPLVESKMGSEQADFRKNRSTIDQIHNLRQILYKCYEFNQDVLCLFLFVDFKQAYDCIDKMEVWKEMKQLKIPKKTDSACERVYDKI